MPFLTSICDLLRNEMIHQLRTYKLTDQGRTEFRNRFRDHAARIMQPYGFKIVGAWEKPDGDNAEFLYMLEWSDESAMKSGWENFLADEEWLGIRSSAKLVDGIMDQFLYPVSLSSER